jgi:hypothetical protein
MSRQKNAAAMVIAVPYVRNDNADVWHPTSALSRARIVSVPSMRRRKKKNIKLNTLNNSNETVARFELRTDPYPLSEG